MRQITKGKFSGNIGDCWALIPAMNEYYRKTGKKITLYLVNGQRGTYYEGATHPTLNEQGEMVMLNTGVIEMMKPLLLQQECIYEVRIYNEQKIDIDFDVIRQTYVGMPNFSINRWIFYVYPDLSCDLSGVWMNVPDIDKNLAKGKIIVTRSERYQNPHINYKFLKKYEHDILFCGTDREYELFNKNNNLFVERLFINDFLELAQAIKQCIFHITNQTQAFQLSEGQKIRRILELCGYAPNCIPIGKDAFDYFSQEGLEYYVDYLYKKTAPNDAA